MHFSKTYTQILASLPPDLRKNAIEYRQLKKLINQVVLELTSLGLNPSLLQGLITNELTGDAVQDDSEQAQVDRQIVYEVVEQGSDKLEPHLRVVRGDGREVVIPLQSDTQFFSMLCTALVHLSEHLEQMQMSFSKTLLDLSRTISSSALPLSASTSHSKLPIQSKFHAYSMVTTHAGSIKVSTPDALSHKSDLYLWREIFQLYLEMEVFEQVGAGGDVGRGQRSVRQCEDQLKLFVEQAEKRGLFVVEFGEDSKIWVKDGRRKFNLGSSREALITFLKMNLFILNVKKLSEASSEATRKILKKHTKRTALPLPSLSLIPASSSSFTISRNLVQLLGTTLLPIIPQLDDYSCLICTSIAFKPIRLECSHLFCVRCLVKMQKRNKGDCPMCRAPVVLSANKSNVDWALLNFMQDWFPFEAREKLKENEREAAREELIEMGLDPDRGCIMM